MAIEHWEGLHKEQVNASRTVQQIKATLRELERTRAQVFVEELDVFDEQMQEPKVKAVRAVESFMRISQVDQLQPAVNCQCFRDFFFFLTEHTLVHYFMCMG